MDYLVVDIQNQHSYLDANKLCEAYPGARQMMTDGAQFNYVGESGRIFAQEISENRLFFRRGVSVADLTTGDLAAFVNGLHSDAVFIIEQGLQPEYRQTLFGALEKAGCTLNDLAL